MDAVRQLPPDREFGDVSQLAACVDRQGDGTHRHHGEDVDEPVTLAEGEFRPHA